MFSQVCVIHSVRGCIPACTWAEERSLPEDVCLGYLPGGVSAWGGGGGFSQAYLGRHPPPYFGNDLLMILYIVDQNIGFLPLILIISQKCALCEACI